MRLRCRPNRRRTFLRDLPTRRPATTKSGDPLHVHSEVQCYYEADFAHRVDICNRPIAERFGDFPVSLVIYGDDDPDWEPSESVTVRYGCKRTFHFRTVELLKYAGQEEALLLHPNPFALLVAHLKCRATKGRYDERLDWKFRVLSALYGRGMAPDDFALWFRVLDWILQLPEPLEVVLQERLLALEKEKQMEYVITPERVGFRKGREEGLDAGRKEGLDAGKQAGLRDSILLQFEVRFGPVPEDVRQRLTLLENLTALQDALRALSAAATAEEAGRAVP